MTVPNFGTIQLKPEEYRLFEEIAQKEGFKTVNDLATVTIVQQLAQFIRGKKMTLQEARKLVFAINLEAAMNPEMDFEAFIKNYRKN